MSASAARRFLRSRASRPPSSNKFPSARGLSSQGSPERRGAGSFLPDRRLPEEKRPPSSHGGRFSFCGVRPRRTRFRAMVSPIHIVGGGLAGSEAAWQIVRRGVPVVLHEMRPGAPDRGAPDRSAGRTGLLQFVPLRRQGAQRRRPAARRAPPRRLADHARRRRPSGAGRRRAWPSTATASPRRSPRPSPAIRW